MRKRILIALPLSCALVCGCTFAKRMTPAGGQAASLEKYAGWNAVALERRDPDLVTGARVDAVVFIQGQPRYRYVRRLNADHVLVFSPKGTSNADTLNGQNSADYRRIIEQNKLELEPSGENAPGAVYCSLRPCYFFWSRSQGKGLTLELRDRPARKDSPAGSDTRIFFPVVK